MVVSAVRRLELVLVLPKISSKQTLKRQVFIQIRPVQSVRGNLHIHQLGGCSFCQARILHGWKTNLHAANHLDHNIRSRVVNFFSRISQGVHFLLSMMVMVDQLVLII